MPPEPESKPTPALGPRDPPDLLGTDHSTMRSLRSLPFLLLLLPLSSCLPLLGRRGSTYATGGIGARVSWPHPAKGLHSGRSPSGWPDTLQPGVLPVAAKAPQASGRGHTSFRVGRQEGGGEAAGFLPTDVKTRGPLGSLAEELNSYSRRKGGFSFRFGR